jgi:transposase
MTKDSTARFAGRTIGLDLSDKEGEYVVLAPGGAILTTEKVPLTAAGLVGRFGSEERCRIAIEAGTHSPWVSRALEAMGHEVIVANPRQIPLIFRSARKTDRIDAVALAELAQYRPRLLHPIRHRGEQAQHDLACIRTREQLVTTRTSLINHVRATVKSVGERLPSCSPRSFDRAVRDLIPEGLRPTLWPVLDIVGGLTRQIKAYDDEIERLGAVVYPETRCLRQVTGVGPLISLGFVLTIENPRRFPASRDVAAYLGLTPRTDQSGAHDPQLGITKAGDELVRKLLVQGAHYILGPFGPDCDLRRWGLKLAGDGNKKLKRRAVVAVARKLAVLLHGLWLTGEVYEPLRQATREQAAAAV